MDRLTLLKTFVVVANEGSFTKAAVRLDTSNQLVSKYVAQLEKHLDARLFNRTTRKIHLTEAGRQCLQHANHILESINDMESQLGLFNTQAKGTLHVSAPVSFSTLHLAGAIGAFHHAHPHVSINLQLNDRKIDVIDEGFDVAIRAGHLASSSLVAKKITTINLALCVSPAYLKKYGRPLHPSDLKPEHYLEYSYVNYDNNQSELIAALKANAQKSPPKLTANNGEVLTNVAKQGEGYVLQPTFIVGEALKKGELVSILDEYIPQSIALYAVYPHRKLISNKLRVFIDFLCNYFEDTPFWDR
ncbi:MULTISPECIES: LysR family transcriptional regulator [Alteromonas]|jgi:DNA-binding transcriptional LysR family regulator|uniref:LysR family transcriptional regulator n=1 Tax=Alteromonas mediterranea TaxID=314275 RepID=A0AAC9NQZ4_9ALTE|nr:MULTISPECIES: LysR family transcriptional regulator [Alteromonas]APD90045.1 LysR family transcriptional regulator [Alteromonas mediterranea]MBR9895956.1 LysR family transcriptional regulator [Gammaproteobacteria bacterium]MEA3380249.1 LysR family transcriptional regulator [Pseudomonadota bacterium]NQY19088.1 LysR family transcriptional regulator [Alteromonas sp.]|tara:strand:+ start:173 stop:1078 length:906 start_codon:yes stop_codon:yes gene_type:complete